MQNMTFNSEIIHSDWLKLVMYLSTQTSVLKTRQTDRWHHLLAISCNEKVVGLGMGSTILKGVECIPAKWNH